MSKEPILETERLILRARTLADAEACFSFSSDERVTKFMSYSTVTDISQTINHIKSTLSDKENYTWVIVLKSENKVIGMGTIGPNKKMKGYWGMGYNLHYDYWHKGYCTEAMKAIIDFVHNGLKVNKICAFHAVDNPRSGKVIEKCGLRFHHYGEYTKNDGSQTFKAKFFTLEL